MRNAAGQFANGFHFLAMTEIGIPAPALGDVHDDGNRTAVLAAALGHPYPESIRTLILKRAPRIGVPIKASL